MSNPPIPYDKCVRCGALTNWAVFIGGHVCVRCHAAAQALRA